MCLLGCVQHKTEERPRVRDNNAQVLARLFGLILGRSLSLPSPYHSHCKNERQKHEDRMKGLESILHPNSFISRNPLYYFSPPGTACFESSSYNILNIMKFTKPRALLQEQCRDSTSAPVKREGRFGERY